MNNPGNIIIADESALFFYEHIASIEQFSFTPTRANPLKNCARCGSDYEKFNALNPLYGGTPVYVLVDDTDVRRKSSRFVARTCSVDLPDGSFLKIRDNLYLATPELVYARMGNLVSEVRLAEIGLNLCGRYYQSLGANGIGDRKELLTTPVRLEKYLDKATQLRGALKARKALRWVIGNSGSPAESKMKLQFSSPLWAGGFALPFTHMNYDVKAGRCTDLCDQNEFCIDCVNPERKTGLEYDGAAYHPDPSADKRRRNALDALGWHVFPIDKSVLYDPDATMRTALQIARYLRIRIRFPQNWEEKYASLRKELALPY